MPSKVSKKFLFLLSALIVIGFFIFFFLKADISLETIKEKKYFSTDLLSVSSVYRYDFEKKEYIFDNKGGWQNSDFTRYIYDLSPEGKNLETCYYFLYDNIEKKVTSGGQRKCNTNLIITVGKGKACSSQGENACTLYVFARDSDDIEGEYGIASYHIDWQKPEVGKPYRRNGFFLTETYDNLNVDYCWLYLNGKNVGSMNIESGLASLEYFFEVEESYSVFVRCADHYDNEMNRYLNFSSGDAAEFFIFKNRPPEINFCKVFPVPGNLKTEFTFEVEVFDPDEDELNYFWDFGDGETSNEKNPVHQYPKIGTFEPKVEVFDGHGGKDGCSTAWVVVFE